MTRERCLEFKRPFGRHKGLGFGEIEQRQPGYTAWVAANCDRAVQRAAQAYLQYQAERN
jgi:hypothetical protein